MIERKTFPLERGCEVAVTTERMNDGTWAVVASITERSERSEKVTDLPVPQQRFASQAEAEDYGRRLGAEWVDRNAPRAA